MDFTELGEPKIEKIEKKEKKQRIKRNKKASEKELLLEYYFDSEKDKDKDKSDKKEYLNKKCFENMQHLSFHERKSLENKFTQPKNGNQETYVNTLKNKNKKIVIASGPAGTGKTLFATELGIKYFMRGVFEKIIFTRPSVSVDEELGFLPGTMEEKMAPWIRPIYDILYQFISPKDVQHMMEEKVIEIAPLGYMRGRTFKNCWIVADEMQNSTVSQMKMLLTRIGENSRLVVTGDLEQYDKPDIINGLEDFLNKFRGKSSTMIDCFTFDRNDIQREEVVKEVLEIYM